MFDASFFTTVLPDRVRTECEARPEMVPVVRFRLGDGVTLDVCHVIHLAERWMAVAYFSDAEKCEDMDVAFVPYDTVTRVHLSLHHPQSRNLGFQLERTEKAPAAVR